jgi:hypothetical protein
MTKVVNKVRCNETVETAANADPQVHQTPDVNPPSTSLDKASELSIMDEWPISQIDNSHFLAVPAEADPFNPFRRTQQFFADQESISPHLPSSSVYARVNTHFLDPQSKRMAELRVSLDPCALHREAQLWNDNLLNIRQYPLLSIQLNHVPTTSTTLSTELGNSSTLETASVTTSALPTVDTVCMKTTFPLVDDLLKSIKSDFEGYRNRESGAAYSGEFISIDAAGVKNTRCAAGVRRILEVCGINARAASAKDYGAALIKSGRYAEHETHGATTATKNITPQHMDVLVFAANENHPHGHTQIYMDQNCTGKGEWYSYKADETLVIPRKYVHHNSKITLYRLKKP